MSQTHIDFTLEGAKGILRRTPTVIRTLLQGLSEDWIRNNEGSETWSPFDIVGHLIHGERTDWIARTKIVLDEGMDGTFVPFDRFAQFEESEGKGIDQLLDEFEEIRTSNLQALDELDISEDQLDRTSNHPNLGVVSLRQLLSTWAAHDLVHLNQMTRVMAKQYKEESGPWAKYITIFGGNQ